MAPIQLYSLATPNGQKVGIALEELGLPYEAHTINLFAGEQKAPDFLKVSPNGRIPAIVDPDGPGGKPLALFESGAIILYLAEKAGGGKLLPLDPAEKWECTSWLFWQMGGVGPMFGQFGHFFKYAPEKVPYGVERYSTETKRLLGVLDARLEGRDYIMGAQYTVADVATWPWVRALSAFYGAGELLGVASFENVAAWLARCEARPASKAGLEATPIPGGPPSSLPQQKPDDAAKKE